MISRSLRLTRLAAKSLWLHKLRSLLTALGIMFGVGSVVAMQAIGEGASKDAQQQYLRLGSRNLIVRSVKPPESSTASAARAFVVAYGLLRSDVDAIAETVPGIARVVSRRDLPQDLWNGARKVPSGRVFGTEPSYREVTNLRVTLGRFLSDDDGARRRNVCVIGATVADELFPGLDPLSGSVRVGGDYYAVIGVVGRRGTAPASGAGASGDEDRAIFVPLETALERFSAVIQERSSGQRSSQKVELHQVVVEAKDVESVPSTAAALRALLAKRHPKEDVQLTVPLELLEEAARTKRIFTIVLLAIAAISLVVGGIGIMNIMLANVTERTREIGIRRALGARRRDIVLQFLAETLLLSTLGGAFGLALGWVLPRIIEGAFGMPTIVTTASMVVALGVSAGVGVLFGLYPAASAADLDPVEALRHA